MASIRKETVIEASPERVWDAVRDVGAVHERLASGFVVDTRLEDVCGNRVGEPFEVDVFKPIERKIETKTAERTFGVR